MQIGVNDELQQLCYFFPALTANISFGVAAVNNSYPELRLPFDIAPHILIIGLGTPKRVFISSAMLHYVNCCQLLSVQSTAQMGIRKPPDHSDGLIIYFLYKAFGELYIIFAKMI